MFQRSRKSREPKAIDSGAFAAASAIGKALNPNGTTINPEKLPRYNSLTANRTSSMVRSGSMSSRSNSLRKTARTGSISRTGSTVTNGRRLSSLQNKRNSAIDESEFYDAEDTFHEFGGPQASGVLQKTGSSKQATVKKYVPGPHGLVAIEVPVSEKPQNRKSSMKRSTSMNSGLNVRRSSLKKKTSSGSLNSQTKAKSSLRNSVSMNGLSRTLGGPSALAGQTATIEEELENSKPLIEQSLKEETVQQLEDEKQTVTPIVFAKTPKPDTDDKGVQEKDVEEKISEEQATAIEKQEEVNNLLNEAVELEKEINKVEQEISTEAAGSSKTPLSGGEPVEIVVSPPPEIATERTEEPTDKKSEEPVSIKSPQSDLKGGSSMAQYLRSANPYLKKNQETNFSDTVQPTSTNETGSSSLYSSETKESFKEPAILKPLEKTPSPMKSAMKKTNSAGSNSNYGKVSSAANDAYLSLTTAENTRINSQIAEKVTRKPSNRRTTVRPQSMMTGKVANTKPNSATPRTKHYSMQPSSQPNTQRRSQLQPQPQPHPQPQPQTQPQPPERSKSRPHGSKASANKHYNPVKANTSKVSDEILYPPEPPKKRSSFEKQRPQQSHLGFKKLSLREEATDAIYEQSSLNNKFHNGSPQTPTKLQQQQSQQSQQPSSEQTLMSISGGGWKSRFQDSDSEDEGAPVFSSGASGSTQPTAHSTNGGFSLFKHNKGDKRSSLVPPQPQFAGGTPSGLSTSAPGSKLNTPKANKKISNISLRASSVDETFTPVKKNNLNNNRFFSESAVKADEGKKKHGIGGKLKKLFGRKK